jgi:hypothetical protein
VNLFAFLAGICLGVLLCSAHAAAVSRIRHRRTRGVSLTTGRDGVLCDRDLKEEPDLLSRLRARGGI